MPHYEVHAPRIGITTASSTDTRLNRLAERITRLHCSTFSAPSTFVRVSIDGSAAHRAYVAGREAYTNCIVAHLRPRPNKSPDTLNKLIEDLVRIWNEEIRAPNALKDGVGRVDDDMALHNVFIMEDISAGYEQGFILPKGGEDAQWINEKKEEFKKRATAGDKDMVALVKEIERGLGSGPIIKSKL